MDEINKLTQRQKMRLASGPNLPAYETIFVKKKGGEFPVEVTDSKTVWQGQVAVLRIIRDITRRKRLEDALGKVHTELENRLRERTTELMTTANKLEQKQRELMCHKLDLEKASTELVQTNTALSVLARNIDRKREEVEKKIAHMISSRIMPLVEELQNAGLSKESRTNLEVLTAYLRDLTPEATRGHNVIISLSATELRVAIMIKDGFSSDEIARLLFISAHTVKTHRRSIRKKLKIKNKNINLASYLKSKLAPDSPTPDPNITEPLSF
jgi:DNA-binding CsgD family transcriptional regulator